MPTCPSCGKEAAQELDSCPFCGAPLKRDTIGLQERIAELRHLEWQAFAGTVVGFLIFIAGFIFRPAPSLFQQPNYFVNMFLLVVGILLTISMGVWAMYYSIKRKKLLKALDQKTVGTVVKKKYADGQPKFYCRYCGEENKTDAIFCEKCGKQLKEI